MRLWLNVTWVQSNSILRRVCAGKDRGCNKLHTCCNLFHRTCWSGKKNNFDLQPHLHPLGSQRHKKPFVGQKKNVTQAPPSRHSP